MAKGQMLGLSRGKIGNKVFYRISGSNNNEKQGSREYQAEVSNPKTMNQAIQRVKVTPASNFYAAFCEDILDHSFQGVKYGGRCQAMFMEYALSMESGFPFVPKGFQGVIPGEYLMSKGSIPSLDFTFDNDTEQIFITAIKDEHFNELGQWSQTLIGRSGFIKDGDQITFAFILTTNTKETFPFVARVIVDSSSEENLGDLQDTVNLYFYTDGAVAPRAIFTDILGACIIVSRPKISKSNGKVSWLRSSSTMKVNYDLQWLEQFHFSQQAYNNALDSLVGTSKNSFNSDWYLNGGTRGLTENDYPAYPRNWSFKFGNTTQCHDEDNTFYGKYGATITDPEAKKVYLIYIPELFQGQMRNFCGSWSSNGQGPEGQPPTPNGEIFRLSYFEPRELPAEWKGQYDDLISLEDARRIAQKYGYYIAFD